MRTTLELDDDLVRQAKALARKRGWTLGQVISELALRSLPATARPEFRSGIEIFRADAGVPRIDRDLVNRLRDED